MITLLFVYGNETVRITIDGKDLTFLTSNSPYPSKINQLRISKEGCVKEFPDLIDDPDWRTKSIERFNQKIQRMNNEEEIAQYLIEDLKKVGYIPKIKQVKGFRPTNL